MIRTKRVYDPPSPEDGLRLLVMRLWPRGVSKAAVDGWEPGLGPRRQRLPAYRRGGRLASRRRVTAWSSLHSPSVVQSPPLWLRGRIALPPTPAQEPAEGPDREGTVGEAVWPPADG